MEDWRLSDPEFTQFEPRTVQQAILRFRRLQRKGLSPWRYPECFVECARRLPTEEIAKFEKWLVNPGEDNSTFMTVQQFQALPVYQEECKCIEEENEEKQDDSLPVPVRSESETPHL